MHVIENFVGKEYSSSLYKELTSTHFPWFFFESMVNGSFDIEKYLDSYAVHTPVFRHNFVKEGNVNSKGVELLTPLIERIQKLFGNDIQFYNVHANLLTPNSEMIGKYCLPHIDVDYDSVTYNESKCYTGIYYLNTCDALTRLYNEKNERETFSFPEVFTKYSDIATEEDKFVYWETDRFHSGPASANVPRVLLNINFVVKK